MATSGGSAPHHPQPNLELRRRAKDLKLLNPQHAPNLPDVLKKTQVFSYDVREFPFAELVNDVFAARTSWWHERTEVVERERARLDATSTHSIRKSSSASTASTASSKVSPRSSRDDEAEPSNVDENGSSLATRSFSSRSTMSPCSDADPAENRSNLGPRTSSTSSTAPGGRSARRRSKTKTKTSSSVSTSDCTETDGAEQDAAQRRRRSQEDLEQLPWQLSLLHHTSQGQNMVKFPPRSGHDPFRRAWMYIFKDAEFRPRINALFKKFVQKVIKPHLQGLLGEENGAFEVMYQTEPSLRVHIRNVKPLGVPHTDADYYHQPGEINFWWPVVDEVYGSNSLYCESGKGKGDYEPFSAKYGEVVQFYGNQNLHFTELNDTERSRVSFDLRVVPGEYYCDSWQRGEGVVPFKLGGYYAKV